MNADIVIVGAGIAGLWTLAQLRGLGYNAVLLESRSIGGIQSIASQGIIHSGLKYAFAGKINALAKSISAMPDLWREALKGNGPVNLSAAKTSSHSQYLLIPPGIMGGLVKLVASKTLDGVQETDMPPEIKNSGFTGSTVHMNEPVLDIPSVIRALAEPHKNYIRKIDAGADAFSLIEAQMYIFTAAAGNEEIARQYTENIGMETQARPLLMGMLKDAPFSLYAHLVGVAEKPVATITTHTANDGSLVWYIGGAVAERVKESNPQETYEAIRTALVKYLPLVNMSTMAWAALPIDRIEGKSGTQNWMPDTPTIHDAGHAMYCWPTKLTFAPMLADMILKKLNEKQINPSYTISDFSSLPEAPYAITPWDEAVWTKESLVKRA
jgi:hypothetical protein